MRKMMAGLVLLVLSMQAASVRAQSPKYAPFSEYMMTPEAELALARSAAPASVSTHATVKVLTAAGYNVAAQGDNGFVCIVMRGWAAPTYNRCQCRWGCAVAARHQTRGHPSDRGAPVEVDPDRPYTLTATPLRVAVTAGRPISRSGISTAFGRSPGLQPHLNRRHWRRRHPGPHALQRRRRHRRPLS